MRTMLCAVVLAATAMTTAVGCADTAEEEGVESAESAVNIAGDLIAVAPGSWVWAGHQKPGETNLRHQLRMLIDEQVGGEIDITLFRLDQVIYDALVRAKGRGVKVRAVTDGNAYDDKDTREYLRRLKDKLGADDRICRGAAGNGSCLTPGKADGAKVHAKMALFSNSSWVGGKKMQVAYIGSNNFTDGLNGSGVGMYNNAMMFFNPVQSFPRLKAYFEDMHAERKTADYYQGPVCTAPGQCEGSYNGRGHAIDFTVGTQFYFGPDGAGGDNKNVMDTFLNQFDAGGKGTECQVRVSQGQIVEGTGVVNGIIGLRESGCAVYVMTSMETSSAVVARMEKAGIEVRRNDNQHNKFFAVRARYVPNDTWGWFVWTGSRQATMGALTLNDEISVFSGGNAAWAQTLYTSYFYGFGPIWGDARSWKCKTNGSCTRGGETYDN